MRISAENISFSYRNRNAVNHVLDGVSLSVGEGETVGLLGKSGCGKSTLGQIMCGLRRPLSGRVVYQGETLGFPFPRQARREIHILFQHPETSFDPKLSLGDSLREVCRLFGLPYTEEILCEYLKPFGIYAEHLQRLPIQLSGGELQRLALARILLAEPKFIVLDEPTSMLDSVSQAQIIRMLKNLQTERGISYLFITHDEKLCEIVSDHIFIIEDKKMKVRTKE